MDKITAQNPTTIREMFASISRKYDSANSILSCGIHHLWKRRLVRESALEGNESILDCATGTGDLAFQFESALKGGGKVTGTDFCEPMLDVARAKALKQRSRVRFEVADVQNLPYSNHQFDIASISFGIRNVKDPTLALSELGRVVKPDGKVLVLEFGQPRSEWMKALFSTYSNQVLPRIGGWLSGQPEAYRYLQTSSSAFPCRDEFLKIADSTGKFSKMRYLSFQGGIAYLYVLQVMRKQ